MIHWGCWCGHFNEYSSSKFPI